MKQIILSVVVLSAVLFFNATSPKIEAAPPPTDLFISEYIEGSSQNKAIEIYNGTAAPIDMAAGNYVLQLYSNGSPTASVSFNLDGTIAVGDVYVVSRNEAAPAILAQIDVAAPGVINFTGNDAVVLRKGGTSGTIIDAIGQIGFNPGTEWGTGLTSTADNTLTRKSTVCAGDTNGSNVFDPATEWDGFAVDTFTSIGSHSASCGTTFNGNLSVGSGETITSLTNNGGLFQALNAGTLSGSLTVNLTSDLTVETGTHSLNQLTESGAGGYTITFQSSGAARLISGSSAAALINLNGADRVTFSGLSFGPQGLTIRNTSATGATVRMVNDASNNSILSCIVEGGNTSLGSGVVVIGAGPTTGNDGNSISDNIIRDRTDAAGIPLNVIYNDSSGGAGTNSNTVISNNQLINFSQTGLFNGIAENSTISGNTIFQTSTRTTQIFAIQLVGSTGTNTVSQNVIRDHSTTSTFVGINLQSTGGTATVSRNRIYNIDNSSGSTSPFNGIQLIGNDAGATASLENNMVSIVPSILTSQTIHGVLDARSAGTLNMQHNSIYLGESIGTRGGDPDINLAKSAGVAGTWAFRRLSGSTASVSLANNIFFNNRGPGAENYAVGDESVGAGTWSSNHNLYVGTGSTAANFFNLNGVGVDIAAWQTGPPSRDANSIAGVAGSGPFNLSNMFASPNDLHLSIAGNNPAVNNAAVGGAATDFDGQIRPFGAAPDIGADEVQTAPTAADASIAGRVTTVDGRGIRSVRVTVMGGNLPAPLIAATSSFGYFLVEGLRAGETYVVSVSGKRYVFETSVRVVSLGENATDVDFVGEPR